MTCFLADSNSQHPRRIGHYRPPFTSGAAALLNDGLNRCEIVGVIVVDHVQTNPPKVPMITVVQPCRTKLVRSREGVVPSANLTRILCPAPPRSFRLFG